MNQGKEAPTGQSRKESPRLSEQSVQLLHVWVHMSVCSHVQITATVCLSLGTSAGGAGLGWGACSVLARELLAVGKVPIGVYPAYIFV